MSGERPWLEKDFPLKEPEFIDYVYQICLIALRWGLLPHSNIGVLTFEQLRRLREVNASIGLMLETTNPDLICHKAGKRIEERIIHIENAGKLRIPFTTGILIGIGESKEDRREALKVIKGLNDRYGHIQEIIIQNFKPKFGIPTENHPEPMLEEMEEVVQYARELMPEMNIQIPPNLNPRYCKLVDKGANDLGGISTSKDYVNPEHPFKRIEEISHALRMKGYVLEERLPLYPEVDAEFSLVADNLRRELVKDVVTYVVNRNINFTNICTGSCSFCAFHRHPEDSDAYLLNLHQILKKIEEALSHGVTEICIQGGLHPQLSLDFYTEILSEIKKRWPKLHLHAFSPMEVWWMAKRSYLTLSEVLLRLKDNGLDSMPGTAAEILVDEVRKRICPQKLSTSEWVEVITCTHKLGMKTTATMMFGSIETWRERVRHMEVIRNIQRETGGFTEFILLPFVPQNTPLGQMYNIRPVSLKEILKVTAYARLFFGKELMNIQNSWVKIGVEGVKRSLSWGANDFGGTLMEENISRCAGAKHGQYLSREQIKAAIREVGRIPVERNTLYHHLNGKGVER